MAFFVCGPTTPSTVMLYPASTNFSCISLLFNVTGIGLGTSTNSGSSGVLFADCSLANIAVTSTSKSFTTGDLNFCFITVGTSLPNLLSLLIVVLCLSYKELGFISSSCIFALSNGTPTSSSLSS